MEVVCHSYCLDVLAGKPEKMAAMQETNTSIAYNLHLTLEHKILSLVIAVSFLTECTHNWAAIIFYFLLIFGRTFI